MFYDDLVQICAKDQEFASLHELIGQQGPLKDLLTSIMGLSPFLRAIMTRHPEILRDCLFAPVKTHLDDLCEQLADDLLDTAVQVGQVQLEDMENVNGQERLQC